MLVDDDLAEKLARLLIEGNLILFAGAGLSLQAEHKHRKDRKLPLWWELGERVSTQCGVNVEDFRGDVLDLFDSIAGGQSRRCLEDAVRQSLPDDQFIPGTTHRALSKLPWKRVYTTNYDDLLQRSLGEKFPVTNEKEFEYFNRSKEEQPRLIHLHGTLKDMHTLTGEDYEVWSDRHPRATNRFVVDCTENSILFIGYSNSDPHFKHRILPLVKELKANRGQKNYSWMWNPTEAQIQLFNQRDNIIVHPIEADDEWARSMDILVDAYESLKDSGGHTPKRKRHSRRFTRATTEDKPIYINGYKLFYHRDYRNISREKLARKAKVSVARIRTLETVDRDKPLGAQCFKKSSMYEVWNLERALKPNTSLEYGRDEDDFLAFYIEYYKNNWKKSRDKKAPQQKSVFEATKAVVFDFGGTLTVPKFRENTWERIWKSVGYGLEEAHKLHHDFSNRKITHKEWCDLTCEKLRQRDFSRDIFEGLYSEIAPIDGLLDTFKELRSRRIQIHIVSGSLRDIIESALNGASRYVSSIRSNDFVFDSDGIIEKILGHEYDFEGKATFITRLADELSCHPIEILFVGNSLNDEKAATSGARTLCVNPKHTHHYVESMWNNTIREMKNLKSILEYV